MTSDLLSDEVRMRVFLNRFGLADCPLTKEQAQALLDEVPMTTVERESWKEFMG